MEEEPKYYVGERVYYEDFIGDYCEVLEIIEVFPWYQQVYKVKFDDGHVMHTTDEALFSDHHKKPTQWHITRNGEGILIVQRERLRDAIAQVKSTGVPTVGKWSGHTYPYHCKCT